MIDFECQCGAIYHSEEAHIGRCLRCIKCGSPVPILRAETLSRSGLDRLSRGATPSWRSFVQSGREANAIARLCTSDGGGYYPVDIVGTAPGGLLSGIIDPPSRAVQTQPDAGHGSRGSLQSGPGPSAFEVVEVTRLRGRALAHLAGLLRRRNRPITIRSQVARA